MGLENFQNFSKNLFQLQGFQSQESCTQLEVQVNACRKSMMWREKKWLAHLPILTWPLLRTVFDEFSGKYRFITTVLPKKFFQDPSCIGGTPAQIFPEQNRLAFSTRFQSSSISRAKVVGLRNFSEFFKILFQLQGFQSQESCTQLGLQVNGCRKSMIWRETYWLERVFFLICRFWRFFRKIPIYHYRFTEKVLTRPLLYRGNPCPKFSRAKPFGLFNEVSAF